MQDLCKMDHRRSNMFDCGHTSVWMRVLEPSCAGGWLRRTGSLDFLEKSLDSDMPAHKTCWSLQPTLSALGAFIGVGVQI